MKCWAAVLGGCEGKRSGEHIVSKALFEGPSVSVQGLPWCLDEAKSVGLGSITVNRLCQRHNSLLSPLDSAAKAAWETLEELDRLYEARRTLKRPRGGWTLVRYRIDAAALERWFIKTVVNTLQAAPGNVRWSETGESGEHPPRSIVEMVFGLRPVTTPLGAYSVARVGQWIKPKVGVVVGTVRHIDEKWLLCAPFHFRGWPFLLWLTDRVMPPKALPRGLIGSEPDWVGSGLVYHMKQVNVGEDRLNQRSQRLNFDW